MIKNNISLIINLYFFIFLKYFYIYNKFFHLQFYLINNSYYIKYNLNKIIFKVKMILIFNKKKSKHKNKNHLKDFLYLFLKKLNLLFIKVNYYFLQSNRIHNKYYQLNLHLILLLYTLFLSKVNKVTILFD